MRLNEKFWRGSRAQNQTAAISRASFRLNKRPTFRQWLAATWLDLICMVILGVIALLALQAKPLPNRYFPITFIDGDIVFPTLSFPYRPQIILSWVSGFVAIVPPIVIFVLFQIRHRSFWDLNNAIVGLLYSTLIASCTQVILKWAIGGLRPHFLSVCQPMISNPAVGVGFHQIMFDRSICTGDEKVIDNALQSFPSGHTSSGFAGFLFLSLYFNAKLKVFSNFHPQFWKLILFFIPLLGATLMGGSVTVDYYHHWYDAVAGAIIGITSALAAFRTVYASIWDFRFNHVPLIRGSVFSGVDSPSGFTYSTFADDYHPWSEVVATRKAGWGIHRGSPVIGAPGDAVLASSGGAPTDGDPHATVADTNQLGNSRTVPADQMV